VTSTRNVTEQVIRGAIPLVLAKPLGRQGELEISLAPVKLSDLPNTLFAELGCDNALSGPSMFEIPDTTERIRPHHHYHFSDWGPETGSFTDYEVSGFSCDQASWRATGSNP